MLSGDLLGNDGPDFANNGENSYHVVTGSGTEATAVLDGFTITGGNADGSDPHDRGGGMHNYAASPTLANCTFSDNSATESAGGMYNAAGSSPTVIACQFIGSLTEGASSTGGGMANLDSSNPMVTGCVFSGNSTPWDGGGIYNYASDPSVANCTFSGNSANDGGGMYNGSGSNPTVTDCTFSENSANDGGGMANHSNSNPDVINCTFSANSAERYGGGMRGWRSDPTVINCTFSGNSATYGGGMGNNDGCSPTVTNCTFAGNSATYGGGMCSHDGCSPTVTNGILWGNTAPTEPQIHEDSSTTTVTYSDVQGGYSGDGNINADPLFVDGDGPDNVPGTEDDNLRLLSYSPCTDAGDNFAPGLAGITTDLDGHSRFADNPAVTDTGVGMWPIVDMGAYEYFRDCNFNSVPDDEETLPTGTIYVDDSAGAGLDDGSSWTNAFWELSTALYFAECTEAVTEIRVAQGTYLPHTAGLSNPRTGTFQLINGVTIEGGYAGYGGGNPDARDIELYETILNGDLNGDDAPVTCTADSECDSYGGLCVDESCIIKQNNAENSYHVVTGSGTEATAVFDGFTITGGNADGSGAHARGGGMYNEPGSPTLTNCTFSGNSADDGGGMLNLGIGGPTVTNCTFSGNRSASSGGGIVNYFSSPTVTNCIFWGDTAPSDPEIHNQSGTPVVTYSDVSGGYPGAGNIDADPVFVDAGFWDDNGTPTDPDDDFRVDGDYHLQEGSPCVNTGDKDYVPPGVVTDFEGDDRVQRCQVDMGVDETPYWRDCNDNGVADACDLEAGTSLDCDTNGVPDECDGVPVLYVDVDAPPGGDGLSWQTAFRNLHDALALAACHTPEIRVAQGTYCPETSGLANAREATFQLKNDVAILGGYAGLGEANPDERRVGLYVTTLSGNIGDLDNPFDNSYHVLTGSGTDETAVLDGFTITAGRANDEMEQEHNRGAGMYNDSGSPTVANCTFAFNSASAYGGGMYNLSSSPALINCVFIRNQAELGGGGIYNNGSDPTLANCTFARNSAWGGGAGAHNLASSPTFTNCILWYNIGEQFVYYGGTPTVTYSDVQDGHSGEGNIDDDPLFVDLDNNDLHLLPESPCIDAADNDAVAPCAFDLEGHDRRVDDEATEDTGNAGALGPPIVDMGAYEFGSAPADCNANRILDECDIAAGTSDDCNVNGSPDECDLTAGTSDDCNDNELPDECDGPDCNINGVLDECDITAGTSGDCQPNGVPDECEDDCQPNGVPDECDLTAGTSNDYDLNGIPDECDPDCQPNGVVDSCDLHCAVGDCESHPLGCGGSSDINHNGRPDECDGIIGLGDEVEVPQEFLDLGADRALSLGATGTQLAFYHAFEDKLFAGGPGILTMTWVDGTGQTLGFTDYIIPDLPSNDGDPPVSATRIFISSNYQAAAVEHLSPYDPTIHWNEVFAENYSGNSQIDIEKQDKTLSFDFDDLDAELVDAGLDSARIVLQYDLDPGGALVGFEVVEIIRFGTVAERTAAVADKLVLPAGEEFVDENENGQWDELEPFTDRNNNGWWDASLADDCRAAIVQNLKVNNIAVAWPQDQVLVTPPDIYPIRPELLSARLRIVWYKKSIADEGGPNEVDLGNCWPSVIEKFATAWPDGSKMQTHVTDQAGGDAPPGSVVALPCPAEVMYRTELDGQTFLAFDPTMLADKNFDTTEPGYSTVKFTAPGESGQCGSDYVFQVVRTFDNDDPAVRRGAPVPWDVGKQVTVLEDLTWWSARTGADCVVQGDPESVKLGDCTSGWVEGLIRLPHYGSWQLEFEVHSATDAAADENDFVDITLNDTLVGTYFNNAMEPVQIINASVEGDNLDYLLEFASGNADPALHISVTTGLATTADEGSVGYRFGYLYSGKPYAVDLYSGAELGSGQIFPINVLEAGTEGRLLEVWSYAVTASRVPDLYWPYRVIDYDPQWPTTGDPIVIASCQGAGSYPDNASTQIYHLGTHPGNDKDTPGWNPNDEHGVLISSVGGQKKAFAARDDNPWQLLPAELAMPRVLVRYHDPADPPDLWRMGVHPVVGEDEFDDFVYDRQLLCDGGPYHGGSCASDADCGCPSCSGDGTCVGDECAGGPAPGRDCTMDAECACTATCAGVCAGGPNDGTPCTDGADCACPPCDDGTCHITEVDPDTGEAIAGYCEGGPTPDSPCIVNADCDCPECTNGTCGQACVGGWNPGGTCAAAGDCAESCTNGTCADVGWLVAGQRIYPLMPPVNMEPTEECYDENDDPLNTVVEIDGFEPGLWVDHQGKLWAMAGPRPNGTARMNELRLWENWADDIECQPWRAFADSGDGTTPYPIIFVPEWPDCFDPADPKCALSYSVGETVTASVFVDSNACAGLKVLHDSVHYGATQENVKLVIHDPGRVVEAVLTTLPFERSEFEKLPPHLYAGTFGPTGEWPDRFGHGDGKLFFRGIMSDRDREFLEELSDNGDYLQTIEDLYFASREPTDDPAGFDTGTLDKRYITFGDAGAHPGWVTIAMNDDLQCSDRGIGLDVEVIRVDCPPYAGDIDVLWPQCPFSEKLVLRFSGDLGGHPEDFVFHWQYRYAGSDEWSDYPVADLDPPYDRGVGLREILIAGASPSTFADTEWRVRYRGYAGCLCMEDVDCSPESPAWPDELDDTADGTQISEWTRPAFAAGWIKRVFSGINLFDNKLKSFHDPTAELDTFVSAITQAGERYEEPVALDCDSSLLNDLGLIEIYETVMRRARGFTIDAFPPQSFASANLAIMLAASKISDLYMLLANEAYADAQDPTIGIFDDNVWDYMSYGPSSIWCFKGLTDSVLEEELFLLRGRGNDVDPFVGTAPVYNRLPWNMMLVDDGRVAYANNYNVPTVERAQEAYPQGHGDAWGHYLTAMKKWYTLLRHPEFEWVVSTEFAQVGNPPQTVEISFAHERRFARAAAAKARTGAAITQLTFRDRFATNLTDNAGYADDQEERAWGVAGWGRRAGMGAYFDWIAANALLDDEDTNPFHEGFEIVDRTTVPEIDEIAAAYLEIQLLADRANTGLNPLGLATNVVPFGLSRDASNSGETHFEQIYARALRALTNAYTAFTYANRNAHRVRAIQDDAASLSDHVDETELDFRSRLIEIFGRPYEDDLGETYPSDYQGPDIYHFDYVDTSELIELDNSTNVTEITVETRMPVTDFSDASFDYDRQLTEVTFHVSTDGLGLVKPPTWTGTRLEWGEIQFARAELLQAAGAYMQALEAYGAAVDELERQEKLLGDLHGLNSEVIDIMTTAEGELRTLRNTIVAAHNAQIFFNRFAEVIHSTSEALAEGVPDAVGPSADIFCVVKSPLLVVGNLLALPFEVQGDFAESAERTAELDFEMVKEKRDLEIVEKEGQQAAREQLAVVEGLLRELPGLRIELYTLQEAVVQAMGRYGSAVGQGMRLLEEFAMYRQNAATDISSLRYKDMAYRIFRNDALQKYRGQFDQAAQYVYLAARAFDYETNLLAGDVSSSDNSGRGFLARIVKERVVGELVDGVPQGGLGGLAAQMAQLDEAYANAEINLGLESPDDLIVELSLRWGLFRIPNDPANPDANGNGIADDEEWRAVLQTLRIADLNRLPDYQQYCNPLTPGEQNPDPDPAIVIPFGSTVESGLNYFGKASSGDDLLNPDRIAVKLRSYAVRFERYPDLAWPDQLNLTVPVYYIPVGTDILRVPLTGAIREWNLLDQTLPMPNELFDTDLEFVYSNDNWRPWQQGVNGGSASLIRRRLLPSVRARPEEEDDPDLDRGYGLLGRSVWNTRWVMIIPSSQLLGDASYLGEGLDLFINGDGTPENPGVSDIVLLMDAYAPIGGFRSSAADGDHEEDQWSDD